MPFPSAVFLPALLLSAAAPAAELRKCIAPSGAVSYQSMPCAQGSRQAWVQPVKAAPPRRDADQPAGKPGASSRKAAPARTRPAPRRQSAREARRERCDAARRQADELRDRLWNKLDFQARSELDAKVARACAR